MVSVERAPEPRHPAFIYDAIRAGQPYHFRTKNPLVHNTINAGVTLLLLLGLGVTVWLGTVVNPWVYVPIAAVVFGWLYFSLFILVVHEASHSMYLVAQNRTLHTWLNRIPGWMVATEPVRTLLRTAPGGLAGALPGTGNGGASAAVMANKPPIIAPTTLTPHKDRIKPGILIPKGLC